jgi:nitrite reductase (cytochrome c-552)
MNNVYERQDKIADLRNYLEEILVSAHYEAKAAWDAGADEAAMKPLLALIRQSQWRWDFCAASHGGSFHAPIEVASILSNGIMKGLEARIGLARVLLQRHVIKSSYRISHPKQEHRRPSALIWMRL